VSVLQLSPVSAKRSPILGYNHNVQYRGLVFHIQTEDSGLKAPHVFTHLFHGGVIVSTRKLVYDSGTVEEGIKSLMQSQHKAVMKELRKGTFDAKIDEYLGGTEGLLASSHGVTEPAPLPQVSSMQIVLPVESKPDIAVATASDSGSLRTARDTVVDDLPVVASATALTESGAIPRRRNADESVAPLPPTPQGRVTTEDLTGVLSSFATINSDVNKARTITPSRVVPRITGPRPSLTPPDVHTRSAMSEGDGDEVAEIHSPAMPSAELASADGSGRIGQYAQHRRRTSSQAAQLNDDPLRPLNPGAAVTATVQNAAAKSPTSERLAVPSAPSSTRPPIPPARTGANAVAAPTRTNTPATTQPRVVTPIMPPPLPPRTANPIVAPVASRPRTPTPARVTANEIPSAARRRPSTGAAGVVMSKPAVVVGGPNRNSPVFQTQTRIRSAREAEPRTSTSNSISEKSLDEVILAYLSEDSKNER
jgi:hypothetical protein